MGRYGELRSVVGAAIASVLRARGRMRGQERDPGWYDEDYAKNRDFYAAPYYSSRYYPVWSVMVDRVRAAGAQRVLEIGCGAGQLGKYLIEQGDVRSYTGVDFSSQAIEIAREVVPAGEFVVGDALDPVIYQRSSIASSAPRCSSTSPTISGCSHCSRWNPVPMHRSRLSVPTSRAPFRLDQ